MSVVFVPSDGGEIVVSRTQGQLKITTILPPRGEGDMWASATSETKVCEEPIWDQAVCWIENSHEEVATNTWRSRLAAIESFCQLLGPGCSADHLTPENFRKELESHRDQGRVDFRLWTGHLKAFAAYLTHLGKIARDELDQMSIAYTSFYTGSAKRKVASAIDEGDDVLSSDEVTRLLRAVRMQTQATRRLLSENPAGKLNGSDYPHSTNDEASLRLEEEHRLAVCLFPVLLALVYAVRSGEINHLALGMIRPDHGQLKVEAPDKHPHVFTEFDMAHHPELIEGWELNRRWQSTYRTSWSPTDPALIKWSPIWKRESQLTTSALNGCLSTLYDRYFEIEDPDNPGAPVLYRDSPDGRVPLAVGFRNLRPSAITEVARKEPDMWHTQMFARHKYPETTEAYYLKQRWEEQQTHITQGLAKRAELIGLALKSRVATPEEVAAAARSPLHDVEVGLCGPSLEGSSCRELGLDCRRCPHLLITPSRKDALLRLWEDDVAAASKAEGEGRIREAQNLRASAALTQAVLHKIREWEVAQ